MVIVLNIILELLTFSIRVNSPESPSRLHVYTFFPFLNTSRSKQRCTCFDNFILQQATMYLPVEVEWFIDHGGGGEEDQTIGLRYIGRRLSSTTLICALHPRLWFYIFSLYHSGVFALNLHSAASSDACGFTFLTSTDCITLLNDVEHVLILQCTIKTQNRNSNHHDVPIFSLDVTISLINLPQASTGNMLVHTCWIFSPDLNRNANVTENTSDLAGSSNVAVFQRFNHVMNSHKTCTTISEVVSLFSTSYISSPHIYIAIRISFYAVALFSSHLISCVAPPSLYYVS